MRHRDFEQANLRRFGGGGEQMQIDVAVVGGGDREHRSYEPRLKSLEQAHRGQGDAPLFLQGVVVRIAPEQSLVRAQRRFELDVFWQRLNGVHSQGVRRLWL